ncbi:calcium-activated chloride channel regulator 4A-like [Mercenaria mercenaria]|uniref:calcium-activated chloride channel regulator 4A-like n=1 Tax=Mercenaria mercenaria TaxID=6596 RepID=UPI00234E7E91|nr:calcium-activated chloride channel regulator 4A-like [Mercenaria mercenaria]
MLTITGPVCLASIVVSGVFSISVNNGGYEDINIVIQNTVAENEILLERIQEVFTKTSQLLFEATRHQVYFRQINIILPKSWSWKSEYTEIPALSELESYITVEEGKVKSPHTKRKRKKCGDPGWYIYLHTDFLFTKGNTEWGPHENVIVHEWAHLRWGLFEEYGSKKRGRFYLDNGIWNPVRCSGSVSGKVGKGRDCTRATSKCKTTDTSRLINENCKFCPDESQAESNLSSILAFNWIDRVSTFCDKENDKTVPVHQRHNSKAPNKHNSKCRGRSAWEVMREHEDFKAAPLSASTNTTPIFNILRETDGYRVFVLDVSGSMQGTRIATLYQACEYIIQTNIPEDSWLGIVWFSSSGSTKMDITRVTSQQVRDALITAVPQTTGGGTCIGCGIDEAIRILSSKRGDPAGSEIMVISDGQNNVGDLDASIENAKEANVIIHTISVSQAADERMISMATATGGIHISYLETGTISFASVFIEILSSGVTSFATESTTILSEKLDSLSSNTVPFSFDIDSSVGINTTVSILQGSSTDISIEVQSPDGTVYTEQTTGGDSLILDIPGTAVTGKYNATVTTQTSTSFEYYVTSWPTGSEVVRISSWVTPINLDFFTGELPVIEADVMKGRAAVLNAIVTAVVETGGSESCEVALLDDGADPDDTIDDGVYAGVIPRFCFDQNGRVSAKVYARGENGTASVQDVFSGAGSPDSDEDLNSTEVLQDSFQRVSLPSEILVSNYSSIIANQDITAPGRITDVSIIDISTENTQYGESRNFTITWTATGDDINIGQATEYELRISDDINVLIDNFSSAELLDVVNANFTPKAAGEVEYIRIEIDAEESYTSTTFFGISAKDEAGNTGDISNIVSILVANGYRIKVEGDVVYSKSYTDEQIEEDVIEEEKKKNLTALIIGLSSTAGIIVIAITAVTVCMKNLKAKESVKDCEFGSRASTTTVVSIDKPLRDFYTNMVSRQTVAKKTFQSAQLQTIPEREESWITSFSSRPSPYQRKPFDIISQGSCSIEMLNGPNNAFSEHMDDYLNTDATSIFEQLSPRSDNLAFDDGMMIENSPEAEVDILPEKGTTAQADDIKTKCKFLAVLEDMPEEFPIQTTDEGLSKEANAQEIVPGTVVILEENHARKENRKGFKRELKEPYFEERSVTCTSLSVEFPALDNDEISQEISKLYDDVNC